MNINKASLQTLEIHILCLEWLKMYVYSDILMFPNFARNTCQHKILSQLQFIAKWPQKW
jgi:hypothetical protein